MAFSLALVAFGGDNIIELVSSWAVLSYLRRTELREGIVGENKRAARRITTILPFLLVLAIVIGMVSLYLMGIVAKPSAFGIGLAVVAVMILPILAIEKNRIGSEGGFLVLKDDAMDSWFCFFMSAALLGGLAMNYLWKIWWVDNFAALIVLTFMMSRALVTLQEIGN